MSKNAYITPQLRHITPQFYMEKFTIKPVLKDYTDKKGQSAILIDVWYDGKHFRKNMNIKVRPDQFIDGKITGHPEAKNLNSVVQAELAAVNLDLLVRGNKLSEKYIKERLGISLRKAVEENDFFGFIENKIIMLANTLSPKTIDAYNAYLTNLKKYTPTATFQNITPEWITGYVHWLKYDKKNLNNTIWAKENFLHGMIQRAVPKYLPENPMDSIGRTQYIDNIPNYLENAEIERLSTLVGTLREGNLRRAGIYFLTDCEIGLRIADLMDFDPIRDIKEGRLMLQTKKRKTIISLKVSDKLQSRLEYLKQYPFDMSTATYDRHLKKLSDLLGFEPRLSAHVARHTLGRRLAKAKVPIAVAQRILGHKSIKSTGRYYHLDDEDIDAAIDMIS